LQDQEEIISAGIRLADLEEFKEEEDGLVDESEIEKC
jgi:hypothetical protein